MEQLEIMEWNQMVFYFKNDGWLYYNMIVYIFYYFEEKNLYYNKIQEKVDIFKIKYMYWILFIIK